MRDLVSGFSYITATPLHLDHISRADERKHGHMSESEPRNKHDESTERLIKLPVSPATMGAAHQFYLTWPVYNVLHRLATFERAKCLSL